jgi:hypothetical protein
MWLDVATGSAAKSSWKGQDSRRTPMGVGASSLCDKKRGTKNGISDGFRWKACSSVGLVCVDLKSVLFLLKNLHKPLKIMSFADCRGL